MKRWVLTAAAGLLLRGLGEGVRAEDRASVIELDPASGGLVFEGIGGVSAGASSRLLIDYPEPQRERDPRLPVQAAIRCVAAASEGRDRRRRQLDRRRRAQPHAQPDRRELQSRL